MNENRLIFTTPALGDTPAATYVFFSSDYKPPRQGRSASSDIVHNQNGIFKYVYDSGPNIFTWDPFELVFSDRFAGALDGKSATQQWQDFQSLWQHLGTKSLEGPEGSYDVHFPAQNIEPRWGSGRFPANSTDSFDLRVTIELEEG